MFLHLVHNNSKRSRRENGIFYVSLVVSVMAFYIILSLENQDVILFLKKMESDAVDKLLGLIPVLYGVTLFILFFLVYFAGKYQMERRNHEFAVYLMLGMRRSRLFIMLLFEEIWSSLLSLAAGIPAAVFLSELISLITAKTVGIGIVGHRFTFSLQAVFWTVAGYFVIRFLALLILSAMTMKKEIGSLLTDSREESSVNGGYPVSFFCLTAGILFQASAYGLGISGLAWREILSFSATLLLGIGGTFLLFRGWGGLFELAVKKKGGNKELGIFTIRQLQETVARQYRSLAVSSLLMLMALCCFGYGISVAFAAADQKQHVMDYTFVGEISVIKSEIESAGLAEDICQLFEIKIGRYWEEEGENSSFSAGGILQGLEALPDSKGKEVLLNNMGYFTSSYLIAESGYNQILLLAGKEPLSLQSNQAALYNGPDFSYGNTVELMESVLRNGAWVEMGGEKYELSRQYCRENLVTDRSISISYGLIVPDEVFHTMTAEQYESYWNGSFRDEVVEKEGLIQCITRGNELLDRTGLKYESYLQNLGRQLFYMTASSYTTIYLAVIFLIMANTVLGVQFLMFQQKTARRYRTLITLGSHYRQLARSGRKQIKWYFALPVAGAVTGSMFGVASLFSGFLVTGLKGNITTLLGIAGAMTVLICVVELLYVTAVMRLSDRHILEMMEGRRDEN